jgi:uncharacterized membrane protein
MTAMTKTEFMAELGKGLRKNGVGESGEILGEYEAHFAYKLADGYSEEEIAAKLGDPAELARQFEKQAAPEKHGGRAFAAAVGLSLIDISAALCFAVLWAWEIAMATISPSCLAVAVCLIGDLRGEHIQLPVMPYGCGLIFGVCLAALAVLAAVGCIYIASFLCRLMRAFARFNRNTMAAASGRPALPPVPVGPQFSAKTRRTLRRIVLAALAVFGVSFVLGMVSSMLSAHALAFWHAWGWFGYQG